MTHRPNNLCPACLGDGIVAVRKDDVFRDEATFHTTPKSVIQAVTEAHPFPAIIDCPKCSGTGKYEP